MSRIILARHGEDEDNAKGILNGRRNMPLTGKGVLQAFNLAENLKKANINVELVVSSPLKRAFSTAKICADIFGVPHIILDYLVERSHGILEGCHWSQIPFLAKKYCRKFGNIYVIEAEGAESYPELLSRSADAHSKLKDFIKERGVKNDLLVVSHGALSRAMLAASKGLTWEKLIDTPSFDNCEFKILD